MLEELRSANRHWAENFPYLGAPRRARKGLAILTCMDVRIDPLAIFNLHPGDANVLRNAGGRVTDDVVRSLVLATNLLGVHSIVVLHHSSCALANTTEETLRSTLRFPDGATYHALGAMPEPDDALVHDVEALRSCDVLPEGLSVVGWRYDVDTGLVEELPTGS